jgi:hypothetical protein
MAIAGGGYHSLGLKADGRIVAWGWNHDGQCDVPNPNAGFVAVAAGEFHSLGLQADGSIVAWGYNDWGQCNVPAPNQDFVAVAGGFVHSLGLKADGSIVAWGENWHGQCEAPAPNSGFLALAGGVGLSLGLKRAPTLDCSYAILPASGTVPFVTQQGVTMTNLSTGQLRRMAGRIDVRIAGGQSFSNWRSGYSNLDPGATFTTAWNQTIPARQSLIGGNLFILLTQDVTPSPYNQPPYPSAGDTCTVTNTVTAFLP